MSEYKADVIWGIAAGDDFLNNQYSRGICGVLMAGWTCLLRLLPVLCRYLFQ